MVALANMMARTICQGRSSRFAARFGSTGGSLNAVDVGRCRRGGRFPGPNRPPESCGPSDAHSIPLTEHVIRGSGPLRSPKMALRGDGFRCRHNPESVQGDCIPDWRGTGRTGAHHAQPRAPTRAALPRLRRRTSCCYGMTPCQHCKRSSTPVALERRAPSAISPGAGRRDDERSKGASTTSHAAIR